ncbi:hypothetical protein MTO96_011388 [Rhipicephalus appendiculatus]
MPGPSSPRVCRSHVSAEVRPFACLRLSRRTRVTYVLCPRGKTVSLGAPGAFLREDPFRGPGHTLVAGAGLMKREGPFSRGVQPPPPPNEVACIFKDP